MSVDTALTAFSSVARAAACWRCICINVMRRPHAPFHRSSTLSLPSMLNSEPPPIDDAIAIAMSSGRADRARRTGVLRETGGTLVDIFGCWPSGLRDSMRMVLE